MNYENAKVCNEVPGDDVLHALRGNKTRIRMRALLTAAARVESAPGFDGPVLNGIIDDSINHAMRYCTGFLSNDLPVTVYMDIFAFVMKNLRYHPRLAR